MWPFTCRHKWSQFGTVIFSEAYQCCVQARQCEKCGVIEVRAVSGAGTSYSHHAAAINDSLTNGGQSNDKAQS